MFSRSLSLWLAPHRQTEWEGRNGGRVGLLAGGFCCNAAAALKVLRVKKTHFGEKTSVYLGGIGPDRRWDAWKERGQEHKTVRATTHRVVYKGQRENRSRDVPKNSPNYV